MKLKKIISALLTVGMMASLATSTYAYDDDAPNLIVTVSDAYVAEEGNEVYDYMMSQEMDPEEELGSDYTAYLVYFKLADITLGRKTSGSTANQRLATIRMYYSVSGTAKETAIIDTTYYDGQIGDPDNNIITGFEYNNALFKAVVGAGTSFFPSSGTSIVDYTEEEPTEPMLVLLAKVKKGTQLVLTPLAKAYSQDGLNTFIDNSYVHTKTYTGKTENGDLQYMYGADSGLVLKTNTITIGEASAPAGTTVTGDGAGVAVEAADGKVWNDVVISEVAKGTDYVAKFTDSMGTVDTADDESIEFPIEGITEVTDEVNGDATFAVILKTLRNLADITMEILFQAQ